MSLREEAWIPTVGQDSHFTTFWGVPDPFFGTVLSVASPRVQPPLMGAALALSLGGRGLSASPPLLLVCGQGGGQARNELEPSRHPSEPRVPPGTLPHWQGGSSSSEGTAPPPATLLGGQHGAHPDSTPCQPLQYER